MEGQTSICQGSESGFNLVCAPCYKMGKSSGAEGYCLDCCEHLCDQCLLYHEALAMTKHHVLIDKASMPENQDLNHVKDVYPEKCSVHSEKVIEFFCPIDGVFGCDVCIITKHKLCNEVVFIPEESPKLPQSEEYKDFKETLDRLFQQSAEIIQSARESLKTSDELYKTAQHDISAFREEINSTLDKLEEEIKERVEEVNKRNKMRMEKVTIQTNTIKEEIKKLSSDNETLLQREQYCPVFIKMKKTEKQLAEVRDKLEKLKAVCVSFSEFRPCTYLQKVLSGIDAFGKLLVRDTGKTRAEHVFDINISSKDNRPTCKPRGCVLLSDTELVVTDFGNYSVKLINLDKDKVTFERKLRNFPWDVSVISDNKVAVTVPLARKIIFLRCAQNITALGTVCVNGRCFGIACFKNQLVVTYTEPSKVEILDMNGSVLHKFENDTDRNKLFSVPKYVSVHEKDPSIFVSDWGNHSLIKMSMDGHVLFVYKDHLLSQPCQSAIDEAGFVYLCGGGSFNIHLLTLEGKRIKALLNGSEEVGSPYTICYCEDMATLYVGNFLSNYINLFVLTR